MLSLQLPSHSLLGLWSFTLNSHVLGLGNRIWGIPMEISKILSLHSFLVSVLCSTNSSCLSLIQCQSIPSTERVHSALLGPSSLQCSQNSASRQEWSQGPPNLFPSSRQSQSTATYCQCLKIVVSHILSGSVGIYGERVSPVSATQ